jgi:integrative and conjugative element protein (TIGR02256 family)
VTIPQPVQDFLLTSRRKALPSETGGVVLGVIDVEAKRIDVVDALSAPVDSRGTPARFDRGVAGLKDTVSAAQAKTADQIRYIGEWHSHPDGVAAMPSLVDLAQIFQFADMLSDDGVPSLMLIVGDDAVTAVLGDATESDTLSVNVGVET